jgi:hypothetical protein
MIHLIDCAYHQFSARDISGLSRFVATAKQNKHDALTSREVQAIASADIDPHFAHAVADRPCIAEISEAGRFQADKNAGFGAHVT